MPQNMPYIVTPNDFRAANVVASDVEEAHTVKNGDRLSYNTIKVNYQYSPGKVHALKIGPRIPKKGEKPRVVTGIAYMEKRESVIAWIDNYDEYDAEIPALMLLVTAAVRRRDIKKNGKKILPQFIKPKLSVSNAHKYAEVRNNDYGEFDAEEIRELISGDNPDPTALSSVNKRCSDRILNGIMSQITDETTINQVVAMLRERAPDGVSFFININRKQFDNGGYVPKIKFGGREVTVDLLKEMGKMDFAPVINMSMYSASGTGTTHTCSNSMHSMNIYDFTGKQDDEDPYEAPPDAINEETLAKFENLGKMEVQGDMDAPSVDQQSTYSGVDSQSGHHMPPQLESVARLPTSTSNTSSSNQMMGNFET